MYMTLCRLGYVLTKGDGTWNGRQKHFPSITLHSAADLQWPELAHLICPDSSSARNKADQKNPAITDCFFYGRVVKLIDAFYTGVLGATEYLFNFEWQLIALAGFQVHLILSKF